MTTLTFYGGANEIGGTKILLQDRRTKVFLDFGEPFNLGEEQSFDYLNPTNTFGLEGLFEFGLMPEIPRTFGEKQLKFTNLRYQRPDIDGIFISHSHSDHVGHLPYVDDSIPVFMGHGTHLLVDAYHELYPGLFDIGEHSVVNEFKTGDQVDVKDLAVEPIHVEHSVPGAYGFVVRTSKGPLVHTGDLRMHGPRSDMTKEFLSRSARVRPKALLIEGTNMGKEVDHSFTEQEVAEMVDGIIAKSKQLVFGYFPLTNVDRFMTFYNAAVRNKRILVVDFSLARMIQRLRSKVSVLPDVVTDASIRVFHRPSGSGDFLESDYQGRGRRTWYNDFFPRKVTFKDLKERPKRYLMHMNFNHLTDLVYIQPENADFIYSSSEHFYEGEENEEQRKVWEYWMDHFGIAFHKAHCSGHASRADLVKMIETIDPEVLIPVHTDVATEFQKYHDNVILPEKNGTIDL